MSDTSKDPGWGGCLAFFLVASILIAGIATGEIFAIRAVTSFRDWHEDVGCRLAALEQEEPMPVWCATPTTEPEGG